MSGFPINLDLSEYFDDLRKFSSVFVNLSKCKEVRDVGNHIKSVFGLEDNICLVHKKFLIPKSEDINILQQYDIFKVQKCNFYDLQIHKTKKSINNSTCDQKALNLTQSEKTIDLSCRPKQRLKNVCGSPGLSGTLTIRVDNKTSTDSQTISPERSVPLNWNHSDPKDKPKPKKKRNLQSDESDNVGGDILDMSVTGNHSKRRKHSNCFSTDDGSLLSEVCDSFYRDVTKDHQKKHKKRKKHSDEIDNTNLDLSSACPNSFVSDDAKDQRSNKKSKKCRDFLNQSISTDTNKKSMQETTIDFNKDYQKTECSVRKKHKHVKKYSESKGLHDSEENETHTSSPLSISRNHNSNKTSISQTLSESKYGENSSSSNSLEKEKKRIKEEIDQMLMCSELHNNSHNVMNDEKSGISIKHSTDHKLEEYVLESSNTDNTSQEPCFDLSFTNPKRKRKRKHKRKQKREKRLYMLAVGPTVNQLVAQNNAAKSSPPPSEIKKHIFFTEDDFVEEMTVPPTPQTKNRTLPEGEKVTVHVESSKPLNSLEEGVQSQEQSSLKPVSWQDQLLKLARSKPVIFHRNTSDATENKPVLTPQPMREYCTPLPNPNQYDPDKTDNPVQNNSATGDFRKCNGEVASETQNSHSGVVDDQTLKKALPDVCKPHPLPNDLQNINLDNYPIIDKVVNQDLILFKVLKLNEDCEPGVSKPILARVNGISSFPDKISLQIMEGCEECSHCTKAEEAAETFTIELRWTDILEPRLFYP